MSVSVNGLLCGTTLTYTGLLPAADTGTERVIGYRAAKLYCERACASTAAHMCTSEEVARSAQVGELSALLAWRFYWTSGAAFSYNGLAPGNIRDCFGWTSEGSNEMGQVLGVDMDGPGGSLRVYPDAKACSSSHMIACCL